MKQESVSKQKYSHEEAKKIVESFRGISKHTTTDEEYEKNRERAWKNTLNGLGLE